MKEIIHNIIEESIELKRRFININTDLIINAAGKISDSIASGHKLLLFGNGGSAADASILPPNLLTGSGLSVRLLPLLP